MDEIYRSQFRLPYPLYEQLKASADANRRSVNAELVARLEESFRKTQIPNDSGFGGDLREMGFSTTDEAAKAWANRMSRPESRAELEKLLEILLKMLSSPNN
ncbi:Arc family DNA-binding protein [Pseudomonas sp. 273]|uniref:Arc family DNA-binding protein n=1 Tax=Pseudomonas sp. 273 TaxID=75692 RepID=UPI0023D7E717|nr:Arc family DNA-binding protein [Pseudomonas sp. 273]